MLVQKTFDAQEKPFACDVKGCEMTFTNKDHLDWHRKKHEMMLNLGLVNKSTANEVADQTPTPTRFIRNCEEVGLFQDLQHINPFDEIFKKALDLVKSDNPPEPKENNSDDTLHTPHILPHIAENKQKEPNSKTDNACEAFIFPTAVDNAYVENMKSPTIVIDKVQTCLKEKIKENIENGINKLQKPLTKKISATTRSKLYKNKVPKPFLSLNQKSIKISASVDNEVCESETEKSPVIRVKSLNELTKGKNAVKENNVEVPADDRIEKVREMNRAAQYRCRKRKQQMWSEMEDELAFLRQENTRLKQHLKAIILEHSKCQGSNTGSIMVSIVNPESSQSASTKKIVKTCSTVAAPKIAAKADAPSQLDNAKKMTSQTPVPLLIQIIPNTQISLVPPENTSQSNVNSAPLKINGLVKKQLQQKTPRKIVPKLIIAKES